MESSKVGNLDRESENHLFTAAVAKRQWHVRATQPNYLRPALAHGILQRAWTCRPPIGGGELTRKRITSRIYGQIE